MVYCKHILKLKQLINSDTTIQLKYPNITGMLQKNNSVIQTINKVDAPKPPDECLKSFYTKNYEVKILKDSITCTCPDFKYRGPLRFCKHMKYIDKYPEDEWTPYFSDFKAKCEC